MSVSTNSPNLSNPGIVANSSLYTERSLNITAANIIDQDSRLGGPNIPHKSPSPRTLFYDAGFRDPGKYGQFLFYSFGKDDNPYWNGYYKSESAQYNRKVSSLISKNPSAAFLVQKSREFESSLNSEVLGNLLTTPSGDILGGMAAPYNWKDFLYCKHYGTIPNNYMLTLRRFPTPVLDNLDFPASVKQKANLVQGIGRPVAQAVTWMGGNTGNSLNDILKFTTGLKWEEKSQNDLPVQQAFENGLFGNGIGDVLKAVLQGTLGIEEASTQLGFNVAEFLARLAESDDTSLRQRREYQFREKATEEGGPLSDFIWTSVDTIDKTYVRSRGLEFTAGPMNIKFHYDLTSVGQVNTKAAMLDLLGSIMALGTNYGNFLTPAIRYDSNFSAIGFPGGNAGLLKYYTDTLGFSQKYAQKLISDLSALKGIDKGSANGNTQDQTATLTSIFQDASKLKEVSKKLLGKSLSIGLNEDFIANMQMPLSFLTGAPIGEWHLVVGNPCNPIAMIGNLVCDNVTIDFSEKLGPDDFPAEFTATFSLNHGRDRDRGDIESMFNRGDGRLYQSTAPTSSNAQSFSSYADTTGQRRNINTANRVMSGNVYVTTNDNFSGTPLGGNR